MLVLDVVEWRADAGADHPSGSLSIAPPLACLGPASPVRGSENHQPARFDDLPR